jgi:hypothetical protein
MLVRGDSDLSGDSLLVEVLAELSRVGVCGGESLRGLLACLLNLND